jgi:hypothetical protein
MKVVLQFCLVLVILDVSVGLGLERMFLRTTTGEGGGLLNLAVAQSPDVLVLGSSRAKHHVMPSILSPRLSGRVFNAGINGHGFLYSALLVELRSARSRPVPALTLLHLDATSLQDSEDENQKIGVFSFYVDESSVISDVVFQRTAFERLKYLSRSYRANGKVFSIARNVLRQAAPGFDGFEPLEGALQADFQQASRQITSPFVSERKARMFGQFVKTIESGGGRLIVIHSPEYQEDPELHARWLGELRPFLAQYPQVRFVEATELTHPEVFRGHPDLFRDESHLNAEGAKRYSTILAEAIASGR